MKRIFKLDRRDVSFNEKFKKDLINSIAHNEVEVLNIKVDFEDNIALVSYGTMDAVKNDSIFMDLFSVVDEFLDKFYEGKVDEYNYSFKYDKETKEKIEFVNYKYALADRKYRNELCEMNIKDLLLSAKASVLERQSKSIKINRKKATYKDIISTLIKELGL